MIDVTKHGVIGDGVTDNTEALNRLTYEMGGDLYFPAGKYVTGSVRLYSNTALHIGADAVILGSEDRSKFPMLNEVIEGYDRREHAAILWAADAENIRVEGSGTIDGRGYYWWAERGSALRPRIFQPISCKNVTIRDVALRNSPMWTINPVCCKGVTVDNVSVINPYDSPNTDGINPESCQGVHISNCVIDVGDDCITIKAGKENEQYLKRMPCEDLVIVNCTMLHGHGGVVVGSEMSGGVRNVCVSNCVFRGTERGIRFKTRRERGGYIRNIMFSNIVMENVEAAITGNTFYGGRRDPKAEIIYDRSARPVDEGTPVFDSIFINNVICRNTRGIGIYFLGLPEQKIGSINISNVDIEVTGTEKGIEPVLTPDIPLSHGEGIYMENADGIVLNNVNVKCRKRRLELKNCENISINGRIFDRAERYIEE